MEEKQESTKYVLVFHPFIFAIYPVLELYFKVSSSASFSEVWRSFFVILLVLVICLLLVNRWLKDWDRTGFIVSLTIFGLLYYGGVYVSAWELGWVGHGILRHELLLPLWFGLLSVLGSRWVWKKFSNPKIITIMLNLMASVAILLSTTRYIIRKVSAGSVNPRALSTKILSDEDQIFLDAERKPDIYYIILDGYAREDVLQKIYGYDNSDFLRFLEDRGFYVAAESRCNYIQTALSLSSSLNLTYLEGLPDDSADRRALSSVIRDSKVRLALEAVGYKTVTVNSGYPPTTLGSVDVFLSPRLGTKMNEFEGLLIIYSAAVALVDRGYLEVPSAGYAAHRSVVKYALEELPNVVDLPGPKFVFYHIVAPHPPFVIDREGNAVTPDSPYAGLGDGNYFAGTSEIYIDGYIEKLIYVNESIKEAVRRILSESSEPPIIIIQADHGPGAYLNWESIEKSCIWERTSILNAYYLPENHSEDDFYSTITPVNTFRLVFDRYFGTQLGYLNDRTYYSPWERPYNFTELSQQVQEPCVLR
jgi:hypothetical protein